MGKAVGNSVPWKFQWVKGLCFQVLGGSNSLTLTLSDLRVWTLM